MISSDVNLLPHHGLFPMLVTAGMRLRVASAVRRRLGNRFAGAVGDSASRTVRS